MKLIKTTFISGIITFIKIFSGFISTKVIAIWAGPPGVAIVGAFTNFISVVLTTSNGAINNGVIKYTAEYNNDRGKSKSLFSTALIISCFFSLLTAIFLIVWAKFWSKIIFKTELYHNVITVLGISVIFYSLNSLFLSIFNGKGLIKLFSIVNAIGSLITLLMTVVLVYYYQVSGALYALVISQALLFFITVVVVLKRSRIPYQFSDIVFEKTIFKKLSHYSVMAIISVITVPLVQIIIRNYLTKKFGITEAGLWQGVIKISDGYLLLINTALITYYLPKLSSIKNDFEIRKEIFQGYKILVPITFLMSATIYILRFYIIDVLYSAEFYKMAELFFWQLIGDFFKVLSYILAYLMLAKAMIKIYIFTEVFFSVLYLILNYYFTDIMGLEGSTFAFFLNYLLYFLLMVLIFKNLIFKRVVI